MPWLAWIAQWRATLRSPAQLRRQRLAVYLGRWAMVDVFVLSLVIFVAESANAVPSVMGPGVIALVAAVLFGALTNGCIRRQLRVVQPTG
jgi:uncharacterized paraquat-inducible protein A